MNWSEERYVKLFQRDTVTWKRWNWQARCVFPLLLRKVDGAGVLDMGNLDPAVAVSLLIDVPTEVCAAALESLYATGAARPSPLGLVLPNYLEAQTTPASDKLRQQVSRERRRLAEVTEVLEAAVTGRHAASQTVTPSLAKPSQDKNNNPETAPGLVLVGDVAEKPQAERLREVWNEAAPPALARWLKSGPKRTASANARLAEEPNLEVWRKAIASLAGSDFHLGKNDRNWKADPEWLLKPETLTKLLERSYQTPEAPKPTSPFNGTRHYR